MRTIKFRAWSPVLKEMFYGADVSIAYDFDNESFIDYAFHNGEKVDELIMQFTGLHDKNGREIYEGDIVYFEVFDGLVDVSGKAKVYFKDGCFRLNRIHPLCDYFNVGTIEVIGNIYENPELLK